MLLSAIVLLPLCFAVLVWVFPEKWVRPLALALAIMEFLLSLAVFKVFDPSTHQIQLVEQHNWIPQFGITYFLGLDGISLWLVILTTFLTPLIVLGSWTSITQRVRGFHAALFVLQTSMLGTFLALDMILFYVFWELSLIPMYFIVGIWGGKRRIYATLKFFIFTMAGSVLMLLAIIYLMLITESTLGQMSASVLDFYQIKVPFIGNDLFNPQTLAFFAFALAFAIKVPMFPLHTWLPDAHVEAPTPGSVILAGVMLKMGTYGFLRFAIPLFPEAAQHWSWLFLLLAVVGIIYGALVAMVQPDVKKLVAYSSVSHMGYVMLGLFAMNSLGISGGLYQMLNHGISTGALFLLVGMIYERTHSREIADYGGLAGVLPKFTIAFFIVTLSSIAVPLTNGFIGEFLILAGTYVAAPNYAYAAVVGVVLGAAYMLWMVKRVFFGQPGRLVREATQDGHGGLQDLNWRESLTLLPLLVLIFWMGLAPNNFLNWSRSSIDFFVANKSNYRLSVIAQPARQTREAVAQQGFQ